MLSLSKSFAKLSLALLMMAPALSVAQQRPDRDGDVRRLERSVNELERNVDRLNRRLIRVEQYLGDDGGNRPPQGVVFNCMLVDSAYSKTFLGSGSSQLDAEFEAKSNCGKSVNASYCDKGALTCDNNLDMDRRARGYVCVVTDSAYSRQFKGEGSTAVAAEANAKNECQKSVNASYCGKVTPRCEMTY